MKAKNPDGGPDLEIGFPSGSRVQLWGKVCRTCGTHAGGCFSGPGLPEPVISPGAICPACGSGDLELVRSVPVERSP